MNQNIVFVIGAGASKEANLPTGNELKDQISKLLDIRFDQFGRHTSGDSLIISALQAHSILPDGRGEDTTPLHSAARHIRDALPQAISIDNFIDTHRGDQKIALCGKLGIVRSILEAEKNSFVYINALKGQRNINFKFLAQTWYTPFFQLLTENCNKEDLKKRFGSVTLIVFNYDRCIEHFLYYALQNYYRISKDEACELIAHINIYHPYGDVGPLPWKKTCQPQEAVEFGLEPHHTQLLTIANRIKTFTEGTEPDSSEISEIREKMAIADKLVFLGFAFHKLNMQLIKPERTTESKTGKTSCFATTLNCSESDRRLIETAIKNLYQSRVDVEMSNTKCGPFFGEFRRSLSF